MFSNLIIVVVRNDLISSHFRLCVSLQGEGSPWVPKISFRRIQWRIEPVKPHFCTLFKVNPQGDIGSDQGLFRDQDAAEIVQYPNKVSLFRNPPGLLGHFYKDVVEISCLIRCQCWRRRISAIIETERRYTLSSAVCRIFNPCGTLMNIQNLDYFLIGVSLRADVKLSDLDRLLNVNYNEQYII